jgi:hypothetical protein
VRSTTLRSPLKLSSNGAISSRRPTLLGPNEIVRAGSRALALRYHPDQGSDSTEMREFSQPTRNCARYFSTVSISPRDAIPVQLGQEALLGGRVEDPSAFSGYNLARSKLFVRVCRVFFIPLIEPFNKTNGLGIASLFRDALIKGSRSLYSGSHSTL